jgi:arsenate reductase-like glutaredoxin family protein
MEALFVQLENKKSGIKVTAWEQNFAYSESCRHVYLTKKIYRNGNKSTVAAFARATEQEVPEILTANTYFWQPGANASWRRSNEERRNSELVDFMKDNREEAEKLLNERFTEYLIPGEKIKVDSLGAYLSYRGHNYHFDGIINNRSIEKVREAIKERRLSDIKLYWKQKMEKEQFKALLPKTFVTVEDSLNARNCKPATMNFYNNLDLVKKGFHLRALRADALLKIRDDEYTRRAVRTAMQRMQ